MAQSVKCPECGSRRNIVVMTKEAEIGGIVVRRRKCHACDHRWYGLQAAEVAVREGVVSWAGKWGSPPKITDAYLRERLANA
jgi:transcriptional regulator NrdR family protein